MAGSWGLKSIGRFCVGVGRNLTSFDVKILSHLIYFTKKGYQRTFNAICKDNAKKKYLIPVKSDGAYYASPNNIW